VLSTDEETSSIISGWDLDTNYTGSPPMMNTVAAVGILLGLFGLRINFVHRQLGQSFAWLFWIGICATDLYLLNVTGVSEKVWLQGEYVIAAAMRIFWIWLLINWTLSKKGDSWSIYPAASETHT
jgi:hypothetical protein